MAHVTLRAHPIPLNRLTRPKHVLDKVADNNCTYIMELRERGRNFQNTGDIEMGVYLSDTDDNDNNNNDNNDDNNSNNMNPPEAPRPRGAS